MFINCTNHRLNEWSEDQIKAASVWGDIVELPFPNVSPYASTAEIYEIADKYSEQIVSMKPDAVLVQGEMTMCFAIVNKLKTHNILTLAATSERVSDVRTDDSGNSIKTSYFRFVGFREY